VTAGLERGDSLPAWFLQYSEAAEDLLFALDHLDHLSEYGEALRAVLRPMMDLKSKASPLCKQRSSMEPDDVRPNVFDLGDDGDTVDPEQVEILPKADDSPPANGRRHISEISLPEGLEVEVGDGDVFAMEGGFNVVISLAGMLLGVLITKSSNLVFNLQRVPKVNRLK